jgi:2-polyprenyl-6-methoxyphenol hydroxylase-like FAD-dependent oxidoreductase
MAEATSREFETPVLIVGGGSVGLVLALDLATRGIRSTLAERDAGTAVELLAKAGTLNERTMEYCRRLGIADAVANVGFPDDHPRDTVYCTALNGFVLGRDYRPSTRERIPGPESPEILRKCPQFRFDPLVARAVRERGLTRVMYGTSWLAASQDAGEVTSTLATEPDGRSVQVRAKYLVACDGAGSAVRRALGIPFEGRQLDYSVSAMIEFDRLEDRHPLGRAERYMFIGTEGTWAIHAAAAGLGARRGAAGRRRRRNRRAAERRHDRGPRGGPPIRAPARLGPPRRHGRLAR